MNTSILLHESFWKGFYSRLVSETQKVYGYEKGGFTYDIPKEAMIRAELYSHIKKAGLLVEIGSDRFRQQSERFIGEYDLRVLGDPEVALEIKRAWVLRRKDWQNKYSEYHQQWKKDIQKLSEYSGRKAFVVGVYWDYNPFYQKFLERTVEKFEQELGTSWSRFRFGPGALLDKDKTNLSLFVWVRG